MIMLRPYMTPGASCHRRSIRQPLVCYAVIRVVDDGSVTSSISFGGGGGVDLNLDDGLGVAPAKVPGSSQHVQAKLFFC